MKTFRQQLCDKCLKLLRIYEAEKQAKHRRLKIRKVGADEKGKININKKL